MNYVKFCGKNEQGCFPDVEYKSIGSTGYGVNLNRDSRHSKAILNDGVLIDSLTFEPPCSNTAPCGYLRTDVNGSAPPNTLGIDLFTFVVFEDKIVPGGVKGVIDSDYFITRGDACTAQVIYGKNMDYIKDKQCKIWE